MNSIVYSSRFDEWTTPKELFRSLDSVYNFETDLCATHENALCSRYYTKEQDGLAQEWTGVCWMNPPYGRQVGKWMRKAYESARRGATVVCLVPARTDTAWWHDYAAKGKVTFIRGRLRFGGSNNNAPFPSAIIVFDKEAKP